MKSHKISFVINMSYIENGKRSMSLETFVSIANALETTADELLKDSLCCFHTLTAQEADSCLSDCNVYESRIIIDVMKATKQSLRSNMKNGFTRRL